MRGHYIKPDELEFDYVLICKHHGELYIDDVFMAVRKSGKKGFQYVCKKCKKEYNKKNYQNKLKE